MADKCSPGGWTLDTLEKHLSSRIAALEALSEERHARDKERVESVSDSIRQVLAAMDKAVSKSEAADDKRYHSLNELRGALSDNIKTLLPRTEYFNNQTAVDEKINALRNVLEEKIAAASEKVGTTDRALGQLSSSITGKSAGIGAVGGLIVGIAVSLSAVAAVAALIVAIFHR